MHWMPFHQPRVGVGISAERLTLAHVRPRRLWRQRPTVRALRSEVLPAGLVTPSATELNVADVPVLADHLSRLLGPHQSLGVSLTLPDRCGTLALYQIEAVPDQSQEMTALLRWRMKQEDLPVSADAQLVYRVFPVPRGIGVHRQGSTAASVLVCGLRPKILAQYQEVCERARVVPLSIGLHSLRVVDLCRPLLQSVREGFVVSVLARQVLLMAFCDGRPVFLRYTTLSADPVDLTTSILSTIQFYDDTWRAELTERTGESPRPVVIVADHGGPTEVTSDADAGSGPKRTDGSSPLTPQARIQLMALTRDTPSLKLAWGAGVSVIEGAWGTIASVLAA